MSVLVTVIPARRDPAETAELLLPGIPETVLVAVGGNQPRAGHMVLQDLPADHLDGEWQTRHPGRASDAVILVEPGRAAVFDLGFLAQIVDHAGQQMRL